MKILLSPAKTIRPQGKYPKFESEIYSQFTQPKFFDSAKVLCDILSRFDAKSLAKRLKINDSLAEQNYQRYQQIIEGDSEQNPAMYAYNGIVFKNLAPDTMTEAEVLYANEHLLFTSFLYGLLRTLDLISAYRLEGDFRLSAHENVFDFWRTKLTDTLIAETKNLGGILCNLASSEMKQLFDWSRVERELEVLTPEFKTANKTIVVHTKMARGLMSRYIIQNRVKTMAQLEKFDLGGYSFKEGVFQRN